MLKKLLFFSFALAIVASMFLASETKAATTVGANITSAGTLTVATTTPYNGFLDINGDLNQSANYKIYQNYLPVFVASSTNYSLSVGTEAGKNLTNGGTQNTFMGYQAGYTNTTADYNTGVGYQALYANTTGSSNTAIGDGALNINTTGSNNTAVGWGSLTNNTNGSSNTAVGTVALMGNNHLVGSWNTAIGMYALSPSQDAFASTAVGYYAGYTVSSSINNSSSTIVGYKAGGSGELGGDGNILLGYQAADNLTTGKNNIVLGYDIHTPAATSDNTLNIGNIIFANGLGNTGTTIATGTVGIGIAAPTAKLQVSRSTGGTEKLFQVGTTTATDLFSVNSNGRVGIGTSTPWQDMELAVAGDIVVTGNVYKLGTAYTSPDYVFAKYFNNPYSEVIPPDYQMLSLDNLGLYVKEHNHLPGVEMKNNMVDIFESNRLNLEKIEEMTLYILELREQNLELQKRVENLETRIGR